MFLSRNPAKVVDYNPPYNRVLRLSKCHSRGHKRGQPGLRGNDEAVKSIAPNIGDNKISPLH